MENNTPSRTVAALGLAAALAGCVFAVLCIVIIAMIALG